MQVEMTLRTRLLAYFGLLSGISALSFIVLWLYGLPSLGIEGIQASEYRRTIASVETLADKQRDSFERWFEGRRRELHLLSSSELYSAALRAQSKGGTSSARGRLELLNRQLVMLREANPDAYNHLYVADGTGQRLLASTQPGWQTPPPKHAGFLKEGSQIGLSEFIYLAMEPEGPAIIVTNQILAFDDEGMPEGELVGVLVASIGLRTLLHDAERAIQHQLHGAGDLMLIDHEKRILLASSQRQLGLKDLSSAVETGSEGAKILALQGGREVLLAFRHLHIGASDGLSMVVARDSDEALASIRFTFLRLLALGLLIFLLAMALMVFATNRLARSEAEIRRLNATLEARVEERTEALEQANSELSATLENLERTRDGLIQSEKLASLGALVAGVAHELNTPIGNSVLVASTLQDRAASIANSSAGLTRGGFQEYTAAMHAGTTMLLSNLERAADLVQSFKQLAVDQTSDQRRSFSLATVAEEAWLSIRPTLKAQPYRLQIDIPGQLHLDGYPGQLSRILINFINNAVLHGFEGRATGTMNLSARTVGDTLVEIVFADDGVGMAEEVRRHVFDPFFTTKLGKGGSGLGMHLAYNVVTGLLGGRIELESAPGKGASFRITIPACAPMAPAASQSEGDQYGSLEYPDPACPFHMS